MSEKRFNSKIGPLIAAVLIVAVVIDIGVIGMIVTQGGDPLVSTVAIVVSLLVAAFIVWILLSTNYAVGRGQLIVRSGPIRYKIPLEQIKSVHPSKSPLSSPAMSLDRMMIRYGEGRRILVSPADKAGFLKAIGHDIEN